MPAPVVVGALDFVFAINMVLVFGVVIVLLGVLAWNGSATMYAGMVKIVCLLWTGAVGRVGDIFGTNKYQ